jgi:hypothetical protein
LGDKKLGFYFMVFKKIPKGLVMGMNKGRCNGENKKD